MREHVMRWGPVLACLAATACVARGGPAVATTATAPGGAPATTVTTPACPRSGITAPEVFERVAPAVAYVETPLGTGSAVLVEPGLLVTNAHVVWPYDTARVVFPDGTELAVVPVAAQDTLADLATLDLAAAGGPPPGVRPVAVTDGTTLPIGTDLYLVGYPAEAESFPQPSLTRGILSRVRRWAPLGTSFLQTDAGMAGGQSGGALVAPDGSVVGFSSMFLGDSDFALAMSAPDVVARLQRLLAGEPGDGPAPRALPLHGGTLTGRATLAEAGDQAVFVFDAAYGDSVDLSADGRGNVTLRAIGPYGDVDLDLDGNRRGRESGTLDVRDDGPYFVVVGQDAPGEVTVRSSAPLAPYIDPDDGATLTPGATWTGLMDFPGDVDTLHVRLDAGRTVTLTVDTIAFSPDVTVERAGGDAGPLPLDPRLGGPLGLTLGATCTATEAGDYLVRISDADGSEAGGYLVRIQ